MAPILFVRMCSAAGNSPSHKACSYSVQWVVLTVENVKFLGHIHSADNGESDQGARHGRRYVHVK